MQSAAPDVETNAANVPPAALPLVLRQMIRYVGVAAVAFAVDFATMTGLVRLAHVHYLVGATTGFLLGLAVNYLLSTVWAFAGQPSRIERRWAQFLAFAGIGAIGLVINDLTIWAVTAGLGIDPLISKLVATAVGFFWNFFLRRILIFR